MSEQAFDVLAPGYDQSFSRSVIGFQQRMISRRWLEKILPNKTHLKILEINCGTGEDAIWLASLGHEVIATDQSPKMIEEAESKLEFYDQENLPQFSVCDINEIKHEFAGRKFDLVFSNFAGLNCLDPAQMNVVGNNLQSVLQPGGHLALVLFGKHCFWESMYYLFKLKPGQAFRRWGNESIDVQLKDNVQQAVYYYSTRELCRCFQGFNMIETKPVGLFIPPSYLENAMQKRPGLFNFLAGMEKRFGHFSFTSPLADHSYFLFKNKK
jgi:ubiquinone/menaquinone biosynthesis C-methylase UbiE